MASEFRQSPPSPLQESPYGFTGALLPDPSTSFFYRVTGDSMSQAHIPDGALLVVDRSLRPANGDIVLVNLEGEQVVRRLVRTSRVLVLHPDNPSYRPQVITPQMHLTILGVVLAILIEPAGRKGLLSQITLS